MLHKWWSVMSVAATLVGHVGPVWCSSFASDSSHLVTCSSDEAVRVWKVGGGGGGGDGYTCVGTLNHHLGVVRGCQFSPDSTLLASCSWDKTIAVIRSADFQVKIPCGVSLLFSSLLPFPSPPSLPLDLLLPPSLTGSLQPSGPLLWSC